MPLYDYICPECGRGIEIIQNIDEPAPGCIHCLKPMKKQLGEFVFRFGRRHNYERRGYTNKNVILRGDDGHRTAKQCKWGKGQVRNSGSANRGPAKFADQE